MPETKKIDTKFHNLKLAEVNALTSDSVKLTFEVPIHLKDSYRFIPGQYLTLRTQIDGKRVSRCYSICSPADSGMLSVAIRQVNGGLFSTHAVSQFAANDVVEVMPPMGQFMLDETTLVSEKCYVGIAGGSGITPIMSMIATVLKSEPQSRFVLFYANRSEQTMMFRDELISMADAHPERFHLVPVYSDTTLNEQLIHEAIASTLKGNTDSLAKNQPQQISPEFQALLDPLPDLNNADSWYLCGPQAMTDTLQQVLLDNAVSAERIQRELFTADTTSCVKSSAPDSAGITGSEGGSLIKVIYEGETLEFNLMHDEDVVLNEALKLRDDLPHACQFGACGTCKAKVLEGTVTMKENMALEDEEVEAGYILTCQAQVTSPVLVLSFDN